MSVSTKDVKDLVLWFRKEGIAWQSLTIGAVHIEGVDTKLQSAPKSPTADRRVSMHQRYGGPLLEQAAISQGLETAVLEEDVD